MHRTIKILVKRLKLKKHKEGGFFCETYRSQNKIKKSNLPKRFSGSRNFSTAIYFLLRGDDISAFHKLHADEIWHYYLGSPLIIYTIDSKGKLRKTILGIHYSKGEVFQTTIKSGLWFAAEVKEKNVFTLAGCTVSPGFDYRDFELGEKNKLIRKYPQHKKLIARLSYE
jgi:predicted cupin superfamily sugar epimerase